MKYRAAESKLHKCLETSGFASFSQFKQIRPLVDIFLYDFKESDPARHKEYTGVPLEPLMKNLVELDKLGARTVLRCPLIPGFNDRPSHFKEIAGLANRLSNVIEINILSYHPLGKSKSRNIGKEYPLGDKGFADESNVKIWADEIQSMTKVPVKAG